MSEEKLGENNTLKENDRIEKKSIDQNVTEEEEEIPNSKLKESNSVNVPNRQKNTCHIFFFSLVNYGLTVFIVYYVTIALPSDLAIMVHERDRNIYLGVISMIASSFSVIVTPIIGAMSDRCFDSWIGRRKPFIFIGIILCICSMIARSFIIMEILVILYAILFVFARIGYTFANTPYSGLVPDIYPDNQYGKVSGAIGCTTILGGVTGSLLGFLYTRIPQYVVSLIISLLLIVNTIPVFIIHEPSKKELQSQNDESNSAPVHTLEEKSNQSEHEDVIPSNTNSEQFQNIELSENPTNNQEPANDELHDISLTRTSEEQIPNIDDSTLKGNINVPQSGKSKIQHFLLWLYGFIKPFTYWDFFWVFTIRFLLQLSMGAAQSYFLYYIKDVLGPKYVFIVWDDWIVEPQDALAVFMTVVLLFSVSSTIIGGLFCDYIGKKWVIMIGGILAMITMIGIVIFPYFNTLVLFGISLGIGIGLFYSVDFGLATDVLPNKNESAKDLGIFNLTTQIPQILSPPFAALVIIAGDAMIPSFRNFGYTLLYSVCAFIQLVSILLVFLLRKGFRTKSCWNR